ncbi:MAG: PIG-L family deacetylase [Planctomycetia bacterium]|nr:PIG-L family deacetylase [Planctomycetia bacterium]
MLNLRPFLPAGSSPRILCLGAHSDDIEIGCGGTILELIEQHEAVSVDWIVFSGSEERAREARDSADAFLSGARQKNVVVKGYRDGFFPFVGAQIKDEFEALKRECKPDLIFTHYRDDRHQDHRLISDLTWNTFRDHLILEYEIPKYDGDFGQPNFFVPLGETSCDRKITTILESFKTQRQKQWFDAETFRAILRIRGMEAGAATRQAEAFYCRKVVLHN